MLSRKKKIIYLIVSIILASLIMLLTPIITDYLDYKQAAQAISAMPWQDGGKITMVREPCVWDTPCQSGVCPPCTISCTLVSGAVGPACTAYIEIDTVGQHGTVFIAAPIGFIYRGGGVHPAPGMSFIAGGASPAQPYVIGIPGAGVGRIDRMVNWFDKYVVALFKE